MVSIATSMPSLEIHRAGSRKLYQILEAEIVVGGGGDSAIKVGGAPDRAAVLTSEGSACRVTAESDEIELNGKPVREHELAHGDVLRVGDTVLVFLVEGQPKPIVPRKLLEPARLVEAPKPRSKRRSAPSKRAEPSIVVAPIRGMPARSARPPAEERERRPRRTSARGSMPPIAVMSLAGLGGIATILVLVRLLQAGSGPDADALLRLAQIKLERGEFAMARSYVDQAERSRPDAAAQRRIREVRQRIDATTRRSADLAAIETARRGFNHLQRVKATYLDGKPPRRATARSFIREVDEWLATHRELCNTYDDQRSMVTQVERWRASHASVAALDQPDQADDVLFEASRLVWPKYKRNYRRALEILDSWLGANPGSADAERVREQRAAWVVESKEFFEKACGQIDKLVAAGRIEIALDRARALADGALPEWAEAARARLAEVEAEK